MRRVLVAAAAAMTLLGLAAFPSHATPTTRGAGEFPYDVGSNDVTATSVLLWTQTSASKLNVIWSTDPAFVNDVHSVQVQVAADHDGTRLVKIDGLTPATTYYYKFQDTATLNESRVGSFLTAPDSSSDVNVDFAYSGDQDGTINQETGQPCFNSFESFTNILSKQPEFYVNLGDTIYSDSKCLASPNSTLDEYRSNYKQNLSYSPLRDLRADTSFYTQWDDHEVRNDFDTQTPPFPDLIPIGRQAFEEYDGVLPARPNLGFYRTFRWGTEAQIFILDERSFRTQEANRMDANGDGVLDCQNSVTGQPDLAPTLSRHWRNFFAQQIPGSGLDQPVPAQCTADLNSSARTMLGAAQRSQFLKDLAASHATFKLIINEDEIQNFFALPYDRWEGYQWERNKILHDISNHHVKNVVWLTTDIHAYLAHTVDFNTKNPGTTGGVQGMVEYTVGPIATDTFRAEINQVIGDDAATKVRIFLLGVNKNFCANLGAAPPTPGAPYYGYGWVHIDAATKTLTVQPFDYSGIPIDGDGQGLPDTVARDNACYKYTLTAS